MRLRSPAHGTLERLSFLLHASRKARQGTSVHPFFKLTVMSFLSTNHGQSWHSDAQASGSGPSLTPSRPAPPVPMQRSDSSTSASYPLQRSNVPSPTSYNTSMQSGHYVSTQPGAGPGSAQTIVRRGWVSVKEDGLRAWIWSKRWIILREQTLTLYKNEVSQRTSHTGVEWLLSRLLLFKG